MKTTTLFAILATGLMAVGGLAMAVEAKPGDGNGGPGGPGGQGGPGQERRDQAMEKRQERLNATEARFQERCAQFKNESRQDKCDHLVEKAFKARRAGVALHFAIAADKRILARVNATIDRVEAKLASGNLTGNQTQALQERLAHLEKFQQRLLDRLQKFEDKLGDLEAKWTEVRDHVKAMKEKRQDGREGNETDTEPSEAPETSESASESASETSEPTSTAT